MAPDTPEVLTTGMVNAIATAGLERPPSRATLQRWLSEMAQATKLRQVTKGVYLNRMGHRDVQPAAAAHWIRANCVVSLAWVLEQAGLTNNLGDTVTCVIPTDASWSNPQIGDRKTSAGTFRFFAMPAPLVLAGERAGEFQDIRDLRLSYPRTRPEKALLDWIYLGATPRSRMTRPPFDIEAQRLDQARLRRVARRMGMEKTLADWQAQRAAFLADPDVRDNASSLFGL